jgi:hypothetical protein
MYGNITMKTLVQLAYTNKKEKMSLLQRGLKVTVKVK